MASQLVRFPGSQGVGLAARPDTPGGRPARLDAVRALLHLPQGLASRSAAGHARCAREFLVDLSTQRQAERIHALRLPLMVLHAPRDVVVDIDAAGRIFAATLHPTSFVSLDVADHLLTRPEDARYASGVIAAWAERYLDAAPAASAAAPAGEAVQVVERGTGKYAITVGRHTLRADESREVGGDDAGPSPYQLFSAALGACTAMTLRMYADHKGWPLGRVAVTLRHAKVHVSDCAECAT